MDKSENTVSPPNAHQSNIEELKKENLKLTQILKEKEDEINSHSRLLVACESATMMAHEVLNPITSIIAKLQHILYDDSDFQLFNIIFKEWKKDYEEGGIELLTELFQSTEEDSPNTLIEDDLHNLVNGWNNTEKDLVFILQQLKRVVLILNSLRGLGRAKSSQRPLNVANAIKMTEALMESALKKRNIQLDYEFNHKSQVLVDENELVQILHNLARNAMQAIHRDGKIHISTSETKERLEIRVFDSGQGITTDIAQKIFESRFTTKKQEDGTGLGLTFSRRLIQKYNGDLELESGHGDLGGAVFLCWISLPEKKDIEE